MYICNQKCPELDWDNEKHCKSQDNKKECPCGNIPKWIEIDNLKRS